MSVGTLIARMPCAEPVSDVEDSGSPRYKLVTKLLNKHTSKLKSKKRFPLKLDTCSGVRFNHHDTFN